MELLQKAILQTLIYADIFDYPLVSQELYRFLITDEALSYSYFRKALSRIVANDERINTNKGFYFLKGREKTVKLREKRKLGSEDKEKIAGRVADWFKLIPWVKIIGITGALAMENADEGDDVDLLIVTTRNRLWLTRFFLILLTELTGVRRRPQDKSASWRNKICLNIFLDEDHLEMPRKQRNIYIAHEVCQVKLLWERNSTYQKFLWENRWVSKFLPNFLDTKILRYKDIKIKKQKSLSIVMSRYLNIFLNFLEKVVYKIQLSYMRSRKTSEKTEQYRAFFHPDDCTSWVLKRYNQKLSKLNF